jgi:hypothetical protein
VDTQKIGIAVAVLTALAGPGWAQTTQVFSSKVVDGRVVVTPMSAEEKERLQDPVFRLVLAQRPDEVRLAKIEEMIQPDRSKRRIFVVDEEIKNPRAPQSRRAVIDFVGDNQGIRLDRNVMLSISFSSERVPEITDVEAWGWDDAKGVYNYYKLDRAGTPARSWKLRATSENADIRTDQEREGSCLACHVSGAPIMKELLFPWNNWHSNRSQAVYLLADTPPDKRWRVATDPGLSGLAEAQTLEGVIMGSIKGFNNRRFEQLVRRVDPGGFVVQDAKRVLRPLFEATEVNFISNSQPSNLHPLAETPPTGPVQPIAIPNSFFLASALFGGGQDLGGSGGLGIAEATQFRSVAVIQPAEYKKLIENSGVKLKTSENRTLRGDTHFAWFAPETAFVANHWIDTLLREKVVTPAFVAAVLAADLETPIFSSVRARLLAFVPDSFSVTAGEAHPDRLARDVIARLEAANPPAGSVEAEFLATLKSPDPLDVVKAKIVAYKDRISQRLSNPSTRNDELERLFGILIARRQAVQGHPVLGNLVESEALLPLP